MAEQLRHFLSIIYKEGEYYELVTKSGVSDKGKYYPLRSKQNIRSFGTEDITTLEQLIQNTPDGAWITSNPIRAEVQGNAASDKDIADYRFVLIESDDISREEQWKQLQELHLPVATVVWSGGKSLHALVRIDAGTDRKLYDNRVRSLYKYLEDKQFKADTANKNPSRLTRVPGFYRGDDMQYLVAENIGPKSWLEFENTVLAPMYKKDMRSITSKINGQQGGRPQIQVTEIAESFLHELKTDKAGIPLLRYYNGCWWEYYDSNWHEKKENDLRMELTGYMQRNNVQSLGRISTSVIKDTLENLMSDNLCGLTVQRCSMPCWLPDGKSGAGYMAFKNGIINLKDIVAGKEPELIPSTSAFFSDKRVDYDYAPNAECPMWLDYINTTFDDQDVREAMQNIFWYILTGAKEFNVGFFFRGDGGDGKTTAVHVLR